jgi:hypothetical protein
MCQAEVIAKTGMTRIERCSHCGCVHLHLGPFSLRLESHTAREVFRTFTTALAAFDAEEPAVVGPEAPVPLKLN